MILRPLSRLQKRLQGAESRALAGVEAARGEAAEATRQLSSRLVAQLAALADVARGVTARCAH